MKLGFAVPVSGSWATPANAAELAVRAEQLGYASVWTFQRLLFPATPVEDRWSDVYRSVLDPVVTLGFLAGQTTRVRLGLAVVNLAFLSPVLLAKQLTTLDVLSAGRLDAGLGLGWARDEFVASGTPYPRRGARAEEYLRALEAIWGDDVVDFAGEFYRIPPSRIDPRPVQRPHPPILLGGTAEPALRRAGRFADGWISGSTARPDRLGHSIEIVRAAARAAGRDPDRLRFIVRGVVRVRSGGDPNRAPLTGSLDEIRSDLPALAAQGVTELFVDLNFDPEVGSPNADPVGSMHRARDVLAALAP